MHASDTVKGPIKSAPAGRTLAGLLLCLVLAACQSVPPTSGPTLCARLDESARVLASPQSSARQRAQAGADYRALAADHLPELLQDAARPDPLGGLLRQDQPGVYAPNGFADIEPVRRPRVTQPGLHRAGLGLPSVGQVFPGGANAPSAGYQVPVTLLALPTGVAPGSCGAALVDPERVSRVPGKYGAVPVAMDLEAPLDATRAIGRRRGEGLSNLLRSDRFRGRPRIVFLQPFDPDKTPVVLIHGLMSTPRMWAPLVKPLLADPRIRARFQFWFFYYPTSQPVPLSALQLREALDDTTRTHGPHRPLVLIGHSMGGILARAQVSRIDLAQAQTISPQLASFPADNPVRRALVFAPRTDVSRTVFMFTPHRGSALAVTSLGAWGIRLIRFPEWVLSEFAHYTHLIPDAIAGRLPTSIHGLSPQSRFLRLLDQTRPKVPSHSIIGDRGRGPLATSSDGVVPFRSAHLDFAESEVIVPTGHSGFDHPLAVAELRRILRAEAATPSKPPTQKASTP